MKVPLMLDNYRKFCDKVEAGRANVPPPITSEKDSPMTPQPLPTPEELRQLLRYEPETGKLFWRERPRDFFGSAHACNAWNARYAMKEALCALNNHGYLKGKVFYRTVSAHRAAWAIHYGQWPDLVIDHINGIPTDNRIENLRLATVAQNGANSVKPSHNTSGFKGVYWCKTWKKWKSAIKVAGKRRNLGTFTTREDAYAAYCKASAELHGEFGRVA
jgi:hypothetical protein